MALSLLLRTDSFCRVGSASSPRMSVSQFSHTQSCFKFFMLDMPFSLRSLFFRNSKIQMLLCPFQLTQLISFQLRFNLFRAGSSTLVSALILLPDRLRNWRCSRPSWLNTARELTWFLEALSHSKLGNWETRERSAMALVFTSKQRIYLNRSTTGNSRSISFSAIDRRVQATVRLLAVLPRPLSPPFKASSNFLRSSSAFTLASSSALLRSSSLRRSSS